MVDEQIGELIEELKEFAEENIIIVEGKKDVRALARYGIASVPLKGGLDAFVEEVFANEQPRSVLILTDYDEQGNILHTQLKTALSRYGIEENAHLRRKFHSITRLSHIEGF